MENIIKIATANCDRIKAVPEESVTELSRKSRSFPDPTETEKYVELVG